MLTFSLVFLIIYHCIISSTWVFLHTLVFEKWKAPQQITHSFPPFTHFDSCLFLCFSCFSPELPALSAYHIKWALIDYLSHFGGMNLSPTTVWQTAFRSQTVACEQHIRRVVGRCLLTTRQRVSAAPGSVSIRTKLPLTQTNTSRNTKTWFSNHACWVYKVYF